MAAVSWRDGPPPPAGSFVATTAPANQPIAIGVVSAELRHIGGPADPPRPKAWLGIELGGGEAGRQVQRVLPDSPAAKAEVHVGDEVRLIDGATMNSADQIVRTVGGSSPGQTLKLLVRREDKDVEIAAQLGRPQSPRLPQGNWGGGPFSERRAGFPVVLPHDTPLHPRDCGGPLVGTDGRVVGVNIAFASAPTRCPLV